MATALSGRADAILSGDSDLWADDDLRRQMRGYGVAILGVETFLAELREKSATSEPAD